MVESSTIESLRDALAPVEALRGEHSQLETWVRESFAALDSLHDDLSEWQRELTRQQAALDQREAAVAETSEARRAEADAATATEKRLQEALEECRLLEAENADQLQALEQLDRQLAVVKTELRTVTKHSEELAAALERERERAAEEIRHWTGELREVRRLVELQSSMVARLAGPAADVASAAIGPESAEGGDDAATSAAEMRRRATARRAGFHRPA